MRILSAKSVANPCIRFKMLSMYNYNMPPEMSSNEVMITKYLG